MVGMMDGRSDVSPFCEGVTLKIQNKCVDQDKSTKSGVPISMFKR